MYYLISIKTVTISSYQMYHDQLVLANNFETIFQTLFQFHVYGSFIFTSSIHIYCKDSLMRSNKSTHLFLKLESAVLLNRRKSKLIFIIPYLRKKNAVSAFVVFSAHMLYFCIQMSPKSNITFIVQWFISRRNNKLSQISQ